MFLFCISVLSVAQCLTRLVSCCASFFSCLGGWTALVLWEGCLWRSPNTPEHLWLPRQALLGYFLSLSKLKSALVKFWGFILLLTFFTPLRVLNSTILSLQPMLPLSVFKWSEEDFICFFCLPGRPSRTPTTSTPLMVTPLILTQRHSADLCSCPHPQITHLWRA